jgi:hypothetical protein
MTTPGGKIVTYTDITAESVKRWQNLANDVVLQRSIVLDMIARLPRAYGPWLHETIPHVGCVKIRKRLKR